MDNTIVSERPDKDRQQGFSLLELIIVIVVIGILVAIAIPIFGTAQDDARQSAVEAAAANGVSTAQSAVSQGEDPDISLSRIEDADINLSLVNNNEYNRLDSICVEAEWVSSSADNTATAGPGCDAEIFDPPPSDPPPSVTPGGPGQDIESDTGIMRTQWHVTEDRSEGLSVHLPLSSDFNGTVDWGNGSTTDSDDLSTTEQPSHNYDSPGYYNITIEGTFSAWSQADESSIGTEGLLSVPQWEDTETTSTNFAFINSDIVYVTEPPETIRSIHGMFAYTEDFNQDIGHWDTSNITDIGRLFIGSLSFNQDIGDWDTSNVTIMNSVFNRTPVFNQDINSWDTSNVTDMRAMFQYTESFNQPLGDWDTGNVELMSSMFNRSSSFNQNINSWDVSSVTDTRAMFQHTDAFNQPLGDWETDSLELMSNMFYDAESFNQDLSGWDVGNVTARNNFSAGSNMDSEQLPNFPN